MEKFKVGTKIRKIPTCRHIFHEDCLLTWLKTALQTDEQKCPLCNSEVFPEAYEYAYQSQQQPYR